MIDHDHRHSQPPRFRERLKTGGAAIHRHQQRGALARQHAHRFDIGPVALENPVGNMNQRIQPAVTQMPGQQGRRGGAVDIVVAEDRDLFASGGRIRDALGGGFHLRHGVGIGQQLADGGIEKVLDSVDPDIASRQYPRQHFRQLITLRNRQRPRRPPRIKPVAPQLSGRRMRDAQKSRRCFDRQCGCGKRHDGAEDRRDGPGCK